METLRKINRTMRSIILIMGAALVVLKLFDINKDDSSSGDEEFPAKEFDDIW